LTLDICEAVSSSPCRETERYRKREREEDTVGREIETRGLRFFFGYENVFIEVQARDIPQSPVAPLSRQKANLAL
jgi:hypothetical protein